MVFRHRKGHAEFGVCVKHMPREAKFERKKQRRICNEGRKTLECWTSPQGLGVKGESGGTGNSMVVALL